MELELLQKTVDGLFPGVLGLRFTLAEPDEIRAEMDVTRDVCTLPGILHGGAIMALADTLGAYGTTLSMSEGVRTTTIESKTNFFAPGIEGEKVVASCSVLHRGRTTMVWQTRVERPDGTLVALVTQTQILLPKSLSAPEQMAAMFVGKDTSAAQSLLAELERTGGMAYRGWAKAESDPEARAALIAAAEREDENAEVLEKLVKGRG